VVFCKDASCVTNAEINIAATAKTKTQFKLICETFHFVYKIQQNFTFQNGAKTLQITPIFDGVA